MPELYLSTDIETDGPAPGHYSMLSFASVAFRADRTIVATFERNLIPLSTARQHPDTMKWWQTQPEAWAAHRQNLVAAADAMHDYAAWLATLPSKPFFLAHPVSFDYPFIAWYFHEFLGHNPLRPGAIDLSTFAMALLNRDYADCHRDNLPPELLAVDTPHTHKALDDALGHAMIFCNLLAANKKR